MELPGNPLGEDALEMEYMDCPICAGMAVITQMGLYGEDENDQVFYWRSSCLEGHQRDNYWYHKEADPELDPDDVTWPGD